MKETYVIEQFILVNGKLRDNLGYMCWPNGNTKQYTTYQAALDTIPSFPKGFFYQVHKFYTP